MSKLLKVLLPGVVMASMGLIAVGCAEDNDKMATGDSAPGVTPPGTPTNLDDPEFKKAYMGQSPMMKQGQGYPGARK